MSDQNNTSISTAFSTGTDINVPGDTPETPQGTRTIIQYWDVIAPAPTNSAKGNIMKGMFKHLGKTRRISIEKHCIPVPVVRNSITKSICEDHKNFAIISGHRFIEKFYVLICKKATFKTGSSGKHTKMAIKGNNNGSRDHHHQEDVVHYHDSDDDDFDDESIDSDAASVVSTTSHTMTRKRSVIFPSSNGHQNNMANNRDQLSPLSVVPEDLSLPGHDLGVDYNDFGEEYTTKYEIKVSKLVIEKILNHKVTLKFKHKKKEQIRKIYFNNDGEAQEFVSTFEKIKLQEEEKENMYLEKVTKSLEIDDFDAEVKFLIEIVGAEDLPIADMFSSDPYVVAMFRNKKIHKTKTIKKSLNPVWTLRKKCFFIFSTTARELFLEPDGMTFIVYDHDFDKDDVLGAISVPSRKIYVSNEERREYELKPYGSSHLTTKGSLSIRCRRATENDIAFLAQFETKDNENENGIGLAKQLKHKKMENASEKGPTLVKTLVTQNVKTFKENDEKITKYRVRPGPDPIDGTLKQAWMATKELNEEVMKPSKSFKYLGIGNLAKIYVEILQCDNLPNMEGLSALGNKTDAFVQILYEDCISTTCVIDDCCSPKWMPWTNRAFVLHTNYPSSAIYLGVHDYDRGSALFSDHDFIGRCMVDLTKFRPNTEYLLDYALYTNAMKLDRKQNGTIKIRLRIEVDDPRAYILASLKIPPTIYVNTNSEKKFKSTRSTVNGDFEESQYSIQTIISALLEAKQYKRLIHYIKDIVTSILFWRGTWKLKLRVPKYNSQSTTLLEKLTTEKECLIPFSSILLFIIAVVVVERPSLLPSASFLITGGVMLQSSTFRNNYQNPWYRCHTFTELLKCLILGSDGQLPPERIEVNQNKEAADTVALKWKTLIEKEEEKALKKRLEMEEEQRQLEQDIQEVGGRDTEVATRKKNFALNPLLIVKPTVHPVQLQIVSLIHVLRFVKNVILWEETYYSFLFTLACFSLALAFLILPWVFLLRWTIRLVVWGLLGPWMKLLDPKIKLENEGDKSTVSRLRQSLIPVKSEVEREERKKTRELLLDGVRVKNENVVKYRDFKMYMFGKFLTKVPIIRVDRYLDIPLASSSATPREKEPMALADVALLDAAKDFEVGQQLIGEMIPTVKNQPPLEVPRGQVAKHSNMIKVGELGADIGSDSALQAYLNIGLMTLVAGFISWFGVPLLIQSMSLGTKGI